MPRLSHVLVLPALIYSLSFAQTSRTISSGQGSEPPDVQPPKPPVEQPIPFNHKKHMAMGLKCDVCHRADASSDKMQIATAADCMGCHQTIKADSPEVQKIAQFVKDGQPIPWNRVYQLPDFVFFSHQEHLDAKVECQVCHGPVQEREVLRQEKDLSMNTCVNCHKLRNAPVSCEKCHDIGN